jgi:hypothetical protein
LPARNESLTKGTNDQHGAKGGPVDLTEWLPAALKVEDDDSDVEAELRIVVKSRRKRTKKNNRKKKTKPRSKPTGNWDIPNKTGQSKSAEPPGADNTGEASNGLSSC